MPRIFPFFNLRFLLIFSLFLVIKPLRAQFPFNSFEELRSDTSSVFDSIVVMQCDDVKDIYNRKKIKIEQIKKYRGARLIYRYYPQFPNEHTEYLYDKSGRLVKELNFFKDSLYSSVEHTYYGDTLVKSVERRDDRRTQMYFDPILCVRKFDGKKRISEVLYYDHLAEDGKTNRMYIKENYSYVDMKGISYSCHSYSSSVDGFEKKDTLQYWVVDSLNRISYSEIPEKGLLSTVLYQYDRNWCLKSEILLIEKGLLEGPAIERMNYKYAQVDPDGHFYDIVESFVETTGEHTFTITKKFKSKVK
jgi:hypothetical protein